MAKRQMTPRERGRGIVRREGSEHPVNTFQRAMNQLFDDFFTSFDLSPFSVFEDMAVFRPNINITEDTRHLTITAELPGMDEKDIEINLSKEALTIKGEKHAEKEEEGKESYYAERSFGSFQRVIPIHREINADKAEATFKKGILTITLPKKKEAEVGKKKISIKSD